MTSLQPVGIKSPSKGTEGVTGEVKETIMSVARKCRLYLVALLSLCCMTVQAQEPPKTVVSVKRQDALFHVSASITLLVKPCVAYGLLTDYASLPDFIPGMVEIHAERLQDGQVKVRQVGEVEVLFFHVKMASQLEMTEIPNQRIVFRQTEGDLESYSGEWNFLETSDGTKLTYDATLAFKGFVPSFIAKSVLENEVEKRFEAIAREAQSRKNPQDCGAAQ